MTFPAPSFSSEDDMSSVGTVVSRLMSSDSMELEMFAVASFGFLGGISTKIKPTRPTDLSCHERRLFLKAGFKTGKCGLLAGQELRSSRKELTDKTLVTKQ